MLLNNSFICHFHMFSIAFHGTGTNIKSSTSGFLCYRMCTHSVRLLNIFNVGESTERERVQLHWAKVCDIYREKLGHCLLAEPKSCNKFSFISCSLCVSGLVHMRSNAKTMNAFSDDFSSSNAFCPNKIGSMHLLQWKSARSKELKRK